LLAGSPIIVPDSEIVRVMNGAVRLHKNGDLVGAFTRYQWVLERDPLNAEAIRLVGILGVKLGQYEMAEQYLLAALRMMPDDIETMLSLSSVYGSSGQIDKAYFWLASLLQRDPEHAGGHWNMALTCLRAGLWREGFAEYEWGFPHKTRGLRCQGVGTPWLGEDLSGKRLFVWWEQGLGDSILAARFLPLLKERYPGVHVTLEVQPPLAAWFEGLDCLDRVYPAIDPNYLPEFDYKTSIMSLAHRLDIARDDEITPRIPYLPEPPAWDLDGDYKVGLCWAGSGSNQLDVMRSLPWKVIRALLDIDGVHWYSLQVGDRARDARKERRLKPLHKRLHSFLDTAGAMRGLDLVVTADTAVANAAGALGVQTWVMVSMPSDWRWGMPRDTVSMWYPHVRMYKVERPREWEPVVARMKSDLTEIVSARRSTSCAVPQVVSRLQPTG
jgi:hypothetical protein